MAMAMAVAVVGTIALGLVVGLAGHLQPQGPAQGGTLCLVHHAVLDGDLVDAVHAECGCSHRLEDLVARRPRRGREPEDDSAAVAPRAHGTDHPELGQGEVELGLAHGADGCFDYCLLC